MRKVDGCGYKSEVDKNGYFWLCSRKQTGNWPRQRLGQKVASWNTDLEVAPCPRCEAYEALDDLREEHGI